MGEIMSNCKKCGGMMHGDGYTTVLHCEYVDYESVSDMTPDANPVYCDFEEEALDE